MNLALWAAKTGLDAQNTRMAVIANNLANTNTTGFKAGRAAFQDLMYQNIRQVGAQSTQNTQYATGLTLGTGVRIVATEKDYTQGSVNQTNAPLDLSVTGRGFLQITLPDGTIAYTRDGTFSLDNQGNVVTASGYPLQPAINIPAGTQSVTIGNDGTVTATSASNPNGTKIGQISSMSKDCNPPATTCWWNPPPAARRRWAPREPTVSARSRRAPSKPRM
jgi:flagellar basal-body rod protein FlgG